MPYFDVFLVAQELNDKLFELRRVLKFQEVNNVMFGVGGKLDERNSLLLVFG